MFIYIYLFLQNVPVFHDRVASVCMSQCSLSLCSKLCHQTWYKSRQTLFPGAEMGHLNGCSPCHLFHSLSLPPLPSPCQPPKASQSRSRSRAACQMVSINFEPLLNKHNVHPCGRGVMNLGQSPPLPFLTPFTVTPSVVTYPPWPTSLTHSQRSRQTPVINPVSYMQTL